MELTVAQTEQNKMFLEEQINKSLEITEAPMVTTQVNGWGIHYISWVIDNSTINHQSVVAAFSCRPKYPTCTHTQPHTATDDWRRSTLTQMENTEQSKAGTRFPAVFFFSSQTQPFHYYYPLSKYLELLLCPQRYAIWYSSMFPPIILWLCFQAHAATLCVCTETEALLFIKWDTVSTDFPGDSFLQLPVSESGNHSRGVERQHRTVLQNAGFAGWESWVNSNFVTEC